MREGQEADWSHKRRLRDHRRPATARPPRRRRRPDWPGRPVRDPLLRLRSGGRARPGAEGALRGHGRHRGHLRGRAGRRQDRPDHRPPPPARRGGREDPAQPGHSAVLEGAGGVRLPRRCRQCRGRGSCCRDHRAAGQLISFSCIYACRLETVGRLGTRYTPFRWPICGLVLLGYLNRFAFKRASFRDRDALLINSQRDINSGEPPSTRYIQSCSSEPPYKS